MQPGITTTCSQVFGFGGNSGKNTNNKGKTDVYLNGDLVWTGGKMLTHSYADGEKEKDGYRIDRLFGVDIERC